MAAFFRGLLLFLFGAIVGAGGILFFTPSFQVVVSRGPGAAKPIEVAAAPAPAPVVPPVAPVAPAPAVAAAPAAPSVPAPAPATVAAAPAAAAPATATAEPAIDFKSISEHLILWPNAVSVKTATTVPVLVDGKKVQDLALDVGTVLQVSKVLADGTLEARAKGAKFEIKSTFTDFSAELGKRVAELVAKGTKFDSPFASASAAPAATASAAPAVPAPAAAPATTEAVAATPWVRLTLAQRVDILFGNKPAAVVPTTTVAPVTATPAVTPAPAATPAAAAVPAAAAPTAEAAPAADPKSAEKGKDLDRKINQLFK